MGDVQLGRMMNEDVSSNGKSFLEGDGKVTGGKGENCSRIKDRTGN